MGGILFVKPSLRGHCEGRSPEAISIVCHSRINGNPNAVAVKTEEEISYERFINQKADKGAFKGVRKEK